MAILVAFLERSLRASLLRARMGEGKMRTFVISLAVWISGISSCNKNDEAKETPSHGAASAGVKAAVAELGGAVFVTDHYAVELLPWMSGEVEASVRMKNGQELPEPQKAILTAQIKGSDGQIHSVGTRWDTGKHRFT